MTEAAERAIRVRQMLGEATALQMESRRMGERIARIAERPAPRALCACDGGWVTLGQMVLDTETGEEYEELAVYRCRVCRGGEAA